MLLEPDEVLMVARLDRVAAQFATSWTLSTVCKRGAAFRSLKDAC
jgi:hypothetical protein